MLKQTAFDMHVSLKDLQNFGKNQTLSRRMAQFSGVRQRLKGAGIDFYLREINSAADREVILYDAVAGRYRKFLMFGSNNYLGLANHPRVKQAVKKALDQFGVGLAGPPLLNGYTRLHRLLEEELARLKHCEDALLFSSGYATNVGLLSALPTENDLLLFDQLSHASFRDGIKMSRVQAIPFKHNDLNELREKLAHRDTRAGEVFVGVEGVYSMDGDLAPLDRVARICKQYRAWLIVDDAHGTGVMGPEGAGTAAHFGVEKEIPIQMGTFSKTFAVSGGFVCGDKELIDYLRFFARSYMFSASLPPVVIAAVLAGLEVMKSEPERVRRLRENVRYAARCLQEIGFSVNPQAAIIPLKVPATMDIRKASSYFHRAGIFLNTVEYPAVPLNAQRFRVSLMADHTHEDIDRLVETVRKVYESAKQ